jgi:deazaflavin-dependent oxidoreductase (nitroreductase family)
MLTKIKEVKPPRGVTRTLYRLPIWLFRLRLGWLLIGHFLLLTHVGRKSGLPRQTVLEVLLYDKAKGVYYVLAGWGEQSDWVKNIEKTPQVTIAVEHRHFHARALRLSPEEAEVKVMAYARRHPRLIRSLPRLLGYRIDGTEEDLRALARLGIVVAFEPITIPASVESRATPVKGASLKRGECAIEMTGYTLATDVVKRDNGAMMVKTWRCACHPALM